MTKPPTWRHASLAVTVAATVALAGCSSKGLGSGVVYDTKGGPAAACPGSVA